MRTLTHACTLGVLLIPLISFISACEDSAPAAGGDDAGNDAEVATPFQEQADRGAVLYGENCARCHGDGGEGTSLAPRLVGLAEGALPLDPPPSAMFRDTQFVTVGDVATFAAANMPADAPGTLALDQYLAILAFDLFANGIELVDALTLEGAAGLTIPREDTP